MEHTPKEFFLPGLSTFMAFDLSGELLINFTELHMRLEALNAHGHQRIARRLSWGLGQAEIQFLLVLR